MKNKVSTRVVAGAVAGIAVAGGGAAIAATRLDSPKEENQAVVDDAAKQLGIQPSRLSAALKQALENRIDAAVAAGRLTKQQGDELKQRLESGDVPLFAGPGFGFRDHRGFGHHGPMGGLDAAASFLGMTESRLESQLQSGKTLAQVAKAEGKSVDDLVNAMVAALKKHLDSDVSSGRLSKAQEDSILSEAKPRITDLVNGKRPQFDRREDGHFGFRGPPPAVTGGSPDTSFDGSGI